MAYNQNNNQAAQNPFWDWVRSLETAGAGVDHPAQGQFPFWPPPPPAPGHHHGNHPHPPPPPPGPHGPPPHHDSHHPAPFPFGPGGFFGGRGGGFGGGPGMGHSGGRRGRHGPRHHRETSPSHERSASPEGEKSGSDEEGRENSPHGRHGRRSHHDRRGGRGGRGCGRRGGPPPFSGPGALFDMSGLMQALASHPVAQAFRGYAEQAAGQQSGETLVPEDVDDENNFTPPVDIFSTETSFVLHVALPGAKKEDVGVNWDAEKSVLNIAGVVYRLGDEEFLKCLSKAERKVGAFERTIKLPPGSDEKDEIDGDGITAKLEDGVLLITVPKVEKEWTEVKKVDII